MKDENGRIIEHETRVDVRVYFGRNFQHSAATILESRRPLELYTRLMLTGSIVGELLDTDGRKSPRFGALFDNGADVIPMYLQGWRRNDPIGVDMLIFGQITPQKYGERPQKFFEIKEV